MNWRIQVGDEATSAIWEPAHSDSGTVLVCAHGAGGNMADRGLVELCRVLRSHGLGTVRFNFLYKEQRSGRPDPMPRLRSCFEAVVARTREELHPARLLIGGRSMGGRAGSMMAADGFPCDGLLLFAYPLHPAGKPDQLRDAHLPRISQPTLCFNGTRDALCRRDLMEAVLQRVQPSFAMHWLDGADHSFHVLKSSGRTDAEVLAEVGEATADWMAGAWLARVKGDIR